MMITGVITLYSSNSNCPQFCQTVAQLTAQGKFVIIKPLSEIKQRKKHTVAISTSLAGSLATINQN